jgi:hypothetical protein
MSNIWLIIVGWFVLGFIGMWFKVLYWKWNGKRFNSVEYSCSIFLNELVVWFLMGAVTFFVSIIELLTLLFEKMGNKEIFK